jgi:hypothetical protein
MPVEVSKNHPRDAKNEQKVIVGDFDSIIALVQQIER